MAQGDEQEARKEIDRQLAAAGWIVQDFADMNLAAGQGIAVREVPLATGHGKADYLLYSGFKALGVVEAKKVGETLTGVEVQTEKYSQGLPEKLPAWHRPLPFLYQSTGVETRFTNLLDPDPRSRGVFTFHRPETLTAWAKGMPGETPPPSTLLRRLRQMPGLITAGMRPPQITAIRNSETSLAFDRPRALIQMATGSGKSYCAVAQTYRLVKFGGARRVLFLVDRANLARQALNEFSQYTTPDDGRKFTELYNVQHLRSNTIDPVSRVLITTIQRLYSILKGEPEFDEANEEESAASVLRREPLPVVYNPAIPIETFDFIFIDECHRSIYHTWRQVLDYFDAYLIGLTATPGKQALGFFNQNLVMEYTDADAVADGVGVEGDVYRIRTQITEGGSTVEAGLVVDKRDRKSRKVRWQKLEDDLAYAPNQLDRAVVAEDQIRTVIRTFRDRLFTEIFPGRTEVPKTLIFAKDDSHADDIVRIIREEFGKGNDFCQKITYRTGTARIVDPNTGAVTYKSTNIKAEDLLSAFRNSYNPRIAVTVDMIATGTDVRALEIVFFMRDVGSENYFIQMKGRGARVISPDELRGVTSDAPAKTRYVLIDAVGVTEKEFTDSPPLERNPSIPFKDILKAVSQGAADADTVSTLASRLARLDRGLSPAQRASVEEAAGGVAMGDLIKTLVAAIDPDALEARAREEFQTEDPTPEQIAAAGEAARMEAIAPFHNAALRQRLLDVQADTEQVIDKVSQDTLLFAGVSEEAKERARQATASFRAYLEKHKDEITALQVLYSRPSGKGPTLKDLRELADTLKRPPHSWTPEALWQAYSVVEEGRVSGHVSNGRAVTDLISLVRFALAQEPVLAPFAETVNARFDKWMAEQEAAGRTFTDEQRQWLVMIRDHIAGSLTVEAEDFEYVPFAERGGLGRAYKLFGDGLNPLLEELNGVLVA